MKGLLNPSPPFTTLHPVQGISAEPPTYHKGRSSLMTGAGLHWWLELVFIDDWSWSSLMAKPLLEKRLHSKKWWGWRVGEGWWRVKTTLHPYKSFIYRRLRRLGEGWRVFLKVALYSSNNNYEVSNHFHTGITSIFKSSSSIVSSSPSSFFRMQTLFQ